MHHKVRIIPKRREIDPERMAETLLDLINYLSPEVLHDLDAEADELRERLEGGRPTKKGSAA